MFKPLYVSIVSLIFNFSPLHAAEVPPPQLDTQPLPTNVVEVFRVSQSVIEPRHTSSGSRQLVRARVAVAPVLAESDLDMARLIYEWLFGYEVRRIERLDSSSHSPSKFSVQANTYSSRLSGDIP